MNKKKLLRNIVSSLVMTDAEMQLAVFKALEVLREFVTENMPRTLMEPVEPAGEDMKKFVLETLNALDEFGREDCLSTQTRSLSSLLSQSLSHKAFCPSPSWECGQK